MNWSQCKVFVRSAESLHWERWSEEYVIFNEASGQTHQMDAVKAFVLSLLESHPQNFLALLEELNTVPVLCDAPNLPSVLESILDEFATIGLVEAIAQ
jgi:PqqD family protein of HPr-rel-A system